MIAMKDMQEKETKKTVNTFAAASFFNDLGSDMVYPIWPMFLLTIPGINMSLIGLIDGLGDAVVSISQALSGYLSDRFKKRKIFIWIGYLLASISRLGYAFSHVTASLAFFKVLDRFGKIRGSPRDAMVADVSTKENRGSNFGLLRTMDNLGAVIGILITVTFVGKLGYKNLFLISSVPSLIAALLVMFLIKEKKPKGAGEVKEERKVILWRHYEPDLKKLIFQSGVFALGAFSYSFLMIFADKANFRPTFVPALYLLFTVMATLTSFPFGRLSDKIGRKHVLIISYILWAAVCMGCIIGKSYFLIIAIFILYGFHRGALDTVQKAYVSELAHPDYRASVLGFYQMIIGISALPSSVIAGFLWDKINIKAPFYLSLVLTGVSLILLLFIKKQDKLKV